MTISVNVKLQHAVLFCLVFYGAVLMMPQAIKAVTLLALRGTPEEDFRHRKPFIFLVLTSMITLVASYCLGAVIAVSRFDGSEFSVPQSAYSLYEFTKEASIELFYAGLLLLLAYRASAQASYQRRLGSLFLVIMVFCSVSNAVISATASVPKLQMASSTLSQMYFALYFFTTFFLLFWSIQLRRCGQKAPREVYLFDTNVLSRIITLILPPLVIRAIFGVLMYAIVHPIAARLSWEIVTLVSVTVEGGTFFIAIIVALGLGSIMERGKQEEQERMPSKGRYSCSQADDDQASKLQTYSDDLDAYRLVTYNIIDSRFGQHSVIRVL